jgi:20S proteasome alpha/beta subunit
LTVVVGINCKDGIVVASDSLTTFGRGAPVLRYSNKVRVIEHDGLLHPVTVAAAGYTVYFDKFINRATRQAITQQHEKLQRKLDIVDFCDRVCEPVVAALLKEYQFDRNQFFGVPFAEFGLSMILAGATKEGKLISYTAYAEGLTEPIDQYGTIGSGAAYAELFLRYLLTEKQLDVAKAARLAIYSIRGVELIDPNVGGHTNVKILKMANDHLHITDCQPNKRPPNPKGKMEKVLKNIGNQLEQLVIKKPGTARNRRKK